MKPGMASGFSFRSASMWTGNFGPKSLIAPQPDGAVQGILDILGQPPILLHPDHTAAPEIGRQITAQLATRLADAGHPVCITGTESERERFAPHLPDHPRITELSGQLDLMQLMALQSHAALVVASSTGPLHTAASLGTPVLGLYGSEALHGPIVGAHRPSCQPLRDRGPPR